MRLPSRAVTAVITLCASHWVCAQQPSAAQPLPSNEVIHTTVRRVVEDVVVTDRNGNPVMGLNKRDFSLTEDGQPQTLLSFEQHDGSKPDFIPPAVPHLPANTFVDLPSAPEQGPLYVILYDMVNMDLVDQAHARKALFSYIDSKPPGTRIAIFLNTDGTHLIQGFTEDKALLKAALTSHGPGPHVPDVFLYGYNYGRRNEGASMSLFQQLANLLEGIPGRKNLIWISSYFPLHLYLDPGLIPDSPSITVEQVKEIVALLTRDRIAVYPVDVRGVLIDGGGGNSKMGFPSSAPLQYINADYLAQITGGHAEYSSNDVNSLVKDAMSAGSSYYTLSYSPTNRKEDYSERKIKIRVEGTKYTLAYRRFYYDLPAPTSPNSTSDKRTANPSSPSPRQDNTLDTIMLHGNPMQHGLLFSAHVQTEGAPALGTPQQMAQLQDEPAYFRSRRKKHNISVMKPIPLQRYLVDYSVKDTELMPDAAQAHAAPMLEFVAAAYDADGVLLNGTINDALANKSATPQRTQTSLFRVQQEIAVPQGAVWLRMAVLDRLSNHTGTIEIALPLKQPSPTLSRVPHS